MFSLQEGITEYTKTRKYNVTCSRKIRAAIQKKTFENKSSNVNTCTQIFLENTNIEKPTKPIMRNMATNTNPPQPIPIKKVVTKSIQTAPLPQPIMRNMATNTNPPQPIPIKKVVTKSIQTAPLPQPIMKNMATNTNPPQPIPIMRNMATTTEELEIKAKEIKVLKIFQKRMAEKQEQTKLMSQLMGENPESDEDE